MMLRGVPSAVNSRPPRDAPGVAVNGTVAGNHETHHVYVLHSLNYVNRKIVTDFCMTTKLYIILCNSLKLYSRSS